MAEPQKVEIPPGLFAITTWGMVTGETTQALLDLRGYNQQQGIHNIHYMVIPGGLVDKARNEAVKQMLANKALQYIIFADADMVFGSDSVHRLLMTSYITCPWADAIGGYCQLRGKPWLPTTDCGSGTWESVPPDQGPVEVIRTGSAFILVKRHVYERMEQPWYGVRPAPRAIDVMLELDNYARCKHDGRNPLREHPFWDTLEHCAKQDAAQQRMQGVGPLQAMSSVGEDSCFADRMKALNFRIVVDTSIRIGHLDRQVITPEMHLDAMRESERFTKLAVGMS